MGNFPYIFDVRFVKHTFMIHLSMLIMAMYIKSNSGLWIYKKYTNSIPRVLTLAPRSLPMEHKVCFLTPCLFRQDGVFNFHGDIVGTAASIRFDRVANLSDTLNQTMRTCHFDFQFCRFIRKFLVHIFSVFVFLNGSYCSQGGIIKTDVFVVRGVWKLR